MLRRHGGGSRPTRKGPCALHRSLQHNIELVRSAGYGISLVQSTINLHCRQVRCGCWFVLDHDVVMNLLQFIVDFTVDTAQAGFCRPMHCKSRSSVETRVTLLAQRMCTIATRRRRCIKAKCITNVESPTVERSPRAPPQRRREALAQCRPQRCMVLRICPQILPAV